jgi:TolB-like protein
MALTAGTLCAIEAKHDFRINDLWNVYSIKYKRSFVMKKALFCIFTLFACVGLFAQQPVVAVAPFDAISGISTTDANMITRVFFIRLGNTDKVSLVDRNVVDRILREHSFQAGDWSNQQKTAELGKALNSNWIVRGELEKFGTNILVTVQFYDIQTFRFMGGADTLLANVEEAMSKMDPLVDKLVETISANSSIAPSGRTYNIGDFGPAGGIVFYDKGVFSNGWRYLEAAPPETEFIAQWGGLNTVVGSTRTGIGTGKRNTELIIEKLGYGGAAGLCSQMNFDGFTDWFLPSIDELNLMYQNLKRRGLGGFSNDAYLSSSQRSATEGSNQSFRDGSQYGGYKAYTFLVRAVRAF